MPDNLILGRAVRRLILGGTEPWGVDVLLPNGIRRGLGVLVLENLCVGARAEVPFLAQINGDGDGCSASVQDVRIRLCLRASMACTAWPVACNAQPVA